MTPTPHPRQERELSDAIQRVGQLLISLGDYHPVLKDWATVAWAARSARPPVEGEGTKPCKYGDKSCPCQDGDPCHYEGKNPFPTPGTKGVPAVKAHFIGSEMGVGYGMTVEFEMLDPDAFVDGRNDGDSIELYASPPAPAEKEAEQPSAAPCPRCNGTRVVDDGEIDCYPDGTPFSNGPIKCVKDCPACAPAPAIQPADGAPDAGHPLLQKLVNSICIVGDMACWDHVVMYELRDALNNRPQETQR